MLSAQITLAIEATYLVATTVIKISILCFYRRIADGTYMTGFVRWTWACIVAVALYCPIFLGLILFSCRPVAAYWRMFDLMWALTHPSHCLDEGAILASVTAISTVQDLVVCAIPVVVVWNLRLAWRQKLAVMAIFAVGLLCVVSRLQRTLTRPGRASLARCAPTTPSTFTTSPTTLPGTPFPAGSAPPSRPTSPW